MFLEGGFESQAAAGRKCGFPARRRCIVHPGRGSRRAPGRPAPCSKCSRSWLPARYLRSDRAAKAGKGEWVLSLALNGDIAKPSQEESAPHW